MTTADDPDTSVQVADLEPGDPIPAMLPTILLAAQQPPSLGSDTDSADPPSAD